MDSDQAATALEQQRTDVRALARTLLRGAERRLAGTTTTSTGAWRGCQPAGVDEYRNFRYLAQARVDAGPDAPTPYLEALRAVMEDAGLIVGEVGPGPGGGASTSLPGSRDDLSVVFSDTGGRFVGLDVYGPCVDVPEEDRDSWLRRDEPAPDLTHP